ncbi:beta-galactosidase [Sanguibacter keddieii DSM 10542]|uniref:beta-galactosidase n=1 Tax=Sanguibacter keddieii (strain ATCC 51767 / DSM 10542 / NCFB 3025 / ST-74) TaxID=446469 RepID=D1BEQ5_SANKS|nr:beta-galactosidase [Sanguibacter keddieii DSM 10542]
MTTVDQLLFGAAYYDEYMPTDRIDTDVEMMKAAGITVVRIAESTWSSLEPQPGVFDFTHVDRALDAFEAAGIHVIVGTPTYAVPAWLVQSYPEVLAVTNNGEGRYGARQIMNITSPTYRFHAERVIRRLMERTAHRPGVIGFQVDNETKYYEAASHDVQRGFVKYLRAEFDDDLGALNDAFGLAYWSNRIDAWEDFPDVRGTINGSLGAEFAKYRRRLVEEFLGWQAGIVREYSRDDQFVTQNFDFDWSPGWSYGLQPSVDHFKAAATVDVAGVDIYHPTQSRLTGKEIAFGGDMTRSIKGGDNYLVLETQAQGQVGWLPYPGQLRLQAYSHLASGADGLMYWHWHSIHNSFETYWKGLLSHDLETNPTYEEAGVFGREAAAAGDALLHLRKSNRVAIMVSNEALTALQWFTVETGFIDGVFGSSIGYNDVLRWVYDALFELNVEVDFVSADDPDLGRYALVVAPALYSAPESTITRLREHVEAGGHLVTTFRTAVADEHVTVWHDRAPHGLTGTLGVTYNQFTRPDGVGLTLHGDLAEAATTQGVEDAPQAQRFMELLTTEGAEVLAAYDHPAYGEYAAVTRQRSDSGSGAGSALHLGTMTSPELVRATLAVAVRDAGVWDWPQELAGTVSVRRGTNARGRELTYLLNYSAEPVTLDSPVAGRSVLGDVEVAVGETLTIGAWDLLVVEGEIG